METPKFQGTHLFDRLCWAKENLDAVQSDYRVVYEDNIDECAKILVPDPNWMACALQGGILPPVWVYWELAKDEAQPALQVGGGPRPRRSGRAQRGFRARPGSSSDRVPSSGQAFEDARKPGRRAPEPDEQPRRETRPRSPPPEPMQQPDWIKEVAAKLEEAARAESVVRAPCAAPRWRKRL